MTRESLVAVSTVCFSLGICLVGGALLLSTGIADTAAIASVSGEWPAPPRKPFVVHGATGIVTGRGTEPAGPPFCNSPLTAIPRAVVPGGVELKIAMVAGRYSESFDFGGRTLVIAEDGNWVFSGGGCMHSYECSGVARIEEGRLLLEMKDGDFERGTECACLPVFWGKRVYLLGADELDNLANAINWGREPRSHSFTRSGSGFSMVRVEGAGGTPLPDAPGLPELPEVVSSKLLKFHIEGMITAIQTDGSAEVNLGTDDGVAVGHKFREWRRDGYQSEVEVVAALPESCVVRNTYSTELKPAERLGQKVFCEAKGAQRAK